MFPNGDCRGLYVYQKNAYADPRRIHDVLTVRLTNLRYFISQLRDALFDGILHRDRLLQLRVLRLGFLQDWDIGVGILFGNQAAKSLRRRKT
jgi:hypothetical protein